MMYKLTPWQHSICSLGLLLLVLLLPVMVFGIPAIRAYQNNAEKIATYEYQLQRFHEAREKINGLQKEIVALQNSRGNDDLFLVGATPSLAAADLQRLLKTLVESRQGHLISSQPLMQSGNDELQAVTVKVSMRGDIEVLRGVLLDIAISRPKLIIDNLIIQRQHTSAARTQMAMADRLDIRFDVIAYLNVGSSQVAARE